MTQSSISGEIEGEQQLAEFVVWGPPRQTIVEAWSTTRLPFEPKGWLRDLRTEIRTALQAMSGSHDGVLHAVYGSTDRSFFDAENSLFYNVGSGYFAHLTGSGMRFERIFTHPMLPKPLAAAPIHYQRYAVTQVATGFIHWRAGRILAQWFGVPMPRITTSLKPEKYWYQLRTNQMDHISFSDAPIRRFGLSVQIGMPSGATISFAGVMKCLIDGVISAFHAHDSSLIEKHSGELGTSLAVDSGIVAGLLRDSDMAVLGSRRLLGAKGQWNPADDQCLAVEILTHFSQNGLWHLSGRLYEIEGVAVSSAENLKDL